MKLKYFQLAVILFLASIISLNAQWKKLLDKEGHFIALDNIIIVAADSGVYRSTDYGENWTFNLIGKYNDVYIGVSKFSRNDKYIFASTNVSVYSSQDTGKTWQALGPAPDGFPLYMINVFTRGSLVFTTMAGGGLFRSDDNGQTWFFLGGYRNYDYLWYKDTLFAAAMDGLWCSTDQGLTWFLHKDFDAYPGYISVMSLSQNDKYFYATAWDVIFRSDDYGQNWNTLDTGMPPENINIWRIYAADKFIFVILTDNKVYLSRDYGEHWENFNEGLDTISSGPDFGVSGTNVLLSKDGGLWSYDLNDLSGINTTDVKATQFFLAQNYPNPFNPVTTISYFVPHNSYVSLKVYDLLGKEISTLVSEEKSPGNYEAEFNGKNLSSGIYFYRMQAGEFNNTKKLILLR